MIFAEDDKWLAWPVCVRGSPWAACFLQRKLSSSLPTCPGYMVVPYMQSVCRMPAEGQRASVSLPIPRFP